MLYRAYIVDPSLSTNGQPIGGIKGFLKMSQKLIREMKPDSVVVAWDGEGGSRRRRTDQEGLQGWAKANSLESTDSQSHRVRRSRK